MLLIILWKAIFNAAKSYNVQIIATTHSYECIQAFNSTFQTLKNDIEDIRLYRIDRKDDKFKASQFTGEMIEVTLENNWEIR